MTAAMIAAAYSVLTYLSAALGLAYGAVQFRLSEILCVLPLFTPDAIAGLTLGCLISNIGSSLGPVDMLFGTAATLLSSVAVYLLRNVKQKAIPLFMPVLFNAVIVGAELVFLSSDTAFLPTAASVAVGEIVVIYIGGLPFCMAWRKTKIFDGQN